MVRWLAGLLLLTSAHGQVEKAVRVVEQRAAAEPAALATDTRMRAAELLKGSHPQLARKLALEVADTLAKEKDQAGLTYRVTTVLLAVDPAGAERIAASLPSQRDVLQAMQNYWINKEDWPRAAEIARRKLRSGNLDIWRVLEAIKAKDPEGAAALFRDALAAFPAKPTPGDCDTLLGQMQEIATIDAPSVVKAALRLLEAASAKGFTPGPFRQFRAEFKIGEKTLKSASAGEAILIPVSMYLAALAPESYQAHEKLFAGWAADLAGLEPEKLRRAARPLRMGYASAKPETKAIDDSKLPFSEALAKIRAQDAPSRGGLLLDLLGREKLTTAERDTAARALYEELPRAKDKRARLRFARGLLDTAVEHGMDTWVRQGVDLVVSTLAEVDKCDSDPCKQARRNAPGAWSDVADALREARLKLRPQPAPLAAQNALFDLRQALERDFDFTLTSLDGKPYRLQAHRGRTVLLYFWDSW